MQIIPLLWLLLRTVEFLDLGLSNIQDNLLTHWCLNTIAGQKKKGLFYGYVSKFAARLLLSNSAKQYGYAKLDKTEKCNLYQSLVKMFKCIV